VTQVPRTLTDLFDVARSENPARPFITFYDDATGERVELSYATFGNWVAKTANLIQDAISAQPGESMAILLPPHWQTLVWLIACWETRLVAAPGLEPAKADHAVVGPAALAAADRSPGERIALSLRPLGGRFGPPHTDPLPAGIIDYAAEVPGHGDRFIGWSGRPRPGDPAVLVAGQSYTHADLVERGRGRAHQLGFARSARVLTDLDPSTEDGLANGLLAPLAQGGSIVLCRHLARTEVDRRAAAERATHVLLKDR
jgi:uncharacterized protein (TIGR03089 family)